jgi:phage terminase large subunit-like protein
MNEKNQEIVEKVLAYKLEEHPTLPSPNKRQRMEMIENIGPEKVLDLFLMRENKIKAEQNDPMRYGHELPHWPDADKLLDRFNEIVVLGGNRCLAGETEIYDPVAKVYRRIDQITEPFYVESWDFDLKKKVQGRASRPFQKPVDNLYRAVLSNGEQILCSAEHRVSTPFGWSSLKDIGLGGLVASHLTDKSWFFFFLGALPLFLLNLLPSNVGTYLSRLREDVLHWSETVQDFVSDCPSSLRFYDGRLLSGLKAVLGGLPSQVDAQECKEYAFYDEDGRARKSQCTRPYFVFGLHAILCAGSRFLARFSDIGCHIHGTPSTDTLLSICDHVGAEFHPKCSVRCLRVQLRRLVQSAILLTLRVVSWALTKHNELRLVKVYHKRKDTVWDISVDGYVNYFIGSILHKNSGKTEYAAKRMAQAFVGTDLNGQAPSWVKERYNKRNIRIWCFHTNHMTSVSAQQNVFYKYLPPEIRNIKRTNHTQISFSQKNGFSDNTAVYMGNQIWFLNYAQDIKVVEGGEVDYVWCDELVPQNWLDTLRYRLVTRSGKLIVTFTPVQGYTQVVKEYINSAKVTATRKSPLLPNNNVLTVPKGEMPYQAENLYGRHACIWYHTELNPYNNWERMKQELSGRSSHDIKIRAYGWADQTAGSEFPMFGDHNLWKGDAEEVIPDGSNYMAIDPAGARNWFMLWARVDKHGILWVYREWPDQSYGEWALPSDKPDGRAGPAQKAGAGRGVNEYTELIWSLETAGDKREMIVDRWIDPRTAGTETITKDGGVTVLDLLSQADNPLIFTPSAALPIEERVLLINDLLSWDREKPMEKGVNHPKLMIHESCQNLIYSLKEWTGQDGQKGASKDPIDALGYMVVMQPIYFGGLDWEKQSKRMSMTGSY